MFKLKFKIFISNLEINFRAMYKIERSLNNEPSINIENQASSNRLWLTTSSTSKFIGFFHSSTIRDLKVKESYQIYFCC